MSKFQEIIGGETPVLVDFFAEWCGPCKVMAPYLKQVKDQYGEGLKVIKVDVDKNPEVAMKYQIQGVPTLILFQKGQMRWRQSGVVSAAHIAQVVRPYVGE